MDASIVDYTLKWVDFRNHGWTNIQLIQDPVCETYVERDLFFASYGPLLETLDGRDLSSFVDFFFVTSPLNPSMLCFESENARLDFQDLAREMLLLPEIEEIMAGEDHAIREKRLKLEMEQRKSFVPNSSAVLPVVVVVPKVNVKKKNTSQKPNPLEKRQLQIQKTLQQLTKRLEQESDPAVRKSIEAKMNKTLELCDRTV